MGPNPTASTGQQKRSLSGARRCNPGNQSQLLENAGSDRAPSPAFEEHWRQLWSINSLERLNKEIRSRTDIVGIVP